MPKDNKGHGSNSKGGGKPPIFSPKFTATVDAYHAAHREVMKHDRAAAKAKLGSPAWSKHNAARATAEKARNAADKKMSKQAMREGPNTGKPYKPKT